VHAVWAFFHHHQPEGLQVFAPAFHHLYDLGGSVWLRAERAKNTNSFLMMMKLLQAPEQQEDSLDLILLV